MSRNVFAETRESDAALRHRRAAWKMRLLKKYGENHEARHEYWQKQRNYQRQGSAPQTGFEQEGLDQTRRVILDEISNDYIGEHNSPSLDVLEMRRRQAAREAIYRKFGILLSQSDRSPTTVSKLHNEMQRQLSRIGPFLMDHDDDDNGVSLFHPLLQCVEDAIADAFPDDVLDHPSFDEFETDAACAHDPDAVDMLRDYHEMLCEGDIDLDNIPFNDAFIGLTAEQERNFLLKRNKRAVNYLDRRQRADKRRVKRKERWQTRREMGREGRNARRAARSAAKTTGTAREKKRLEDLDREQKQVAKARPSFAYGGGSNDDSFYDDERNRYGIRYFGRDDIYDDNGNLSRYTHDDDWYGADEDSFYDRNFQDFSANVKRENEILEELYQQKRKDLYLEPMSPSMLFYKMDELDKWKKQEIRKIILKSGKRPVDMRTYRPTNDLIDAPFNTTKSPTQFIIDEWDAEFENRKRNFQNRKKQQIARIGLRDPRRAQLLADFERQSENNVREARNFTESAKQEALRNLSTKTATKAQRDRAYKRFTALTDEVDETNYYDDVRQIEREEQEHHVMHEYY